VPNRRVGAGLSKRQQTIRRINKNIEVAPCFQNIENANDNQPQLKKEKMISRRLPSQSSFQMQTKKNPSCVIPSSNIFQQQRHSLGPSGESTKTLESEKTLPMNNVYRSQNH
jgi:hypothetical protein